MKHLPELTLTPISGFSRQFRRHSSPPSPVSSPSPTAAAFATATSATSARPDVSSPGPIPVGRRDDRAETVAESDQQLHHSQPGVNVTKHFFYSTLALQKNKLEGFTLAGPYDLGYVL